MWLRRNGSLLCPAVLQRLPFGLRNPLLTANLRYFAQTFAIILRLLTKSKCSKRKIGVPNSQESLRTPTLKRVGDKCVARGYSGSKTLAMALRSLPWPMMGACASSGNMT